MVAHTVQMKVRSSDIDKELSRELRAALVVTLQVN